MSDLFHESLSYEDIFGIFGIMAASVHTFQTLTKRAKRMHEFFYWVEEKMHGDYRDSLTAYAARLLLKGSGYGRENELFEKLRESTPGPGTWPLPNLNLGVSVESQSEVERVHHLTKCPAAARWVSLEPLLEEVDLSGYLGRRLGSCACDPPPLASSVVQENNLAPQCPKCGYKLGGNPEHLIHQVVVGGESGEHARPFDPSWARSLLAQGKRFDVPVFVKQMGDNPVGMGPLKTHGGSDPEEWPEDLRVREYINKVRENG